MRLKAIPSVCEEDNDCKRCHYHVLWSKSSMETEQERAQLTFFPLIMSKTDYRARHNNKLSGTKVIDCKITTISH